MKLPSERIEEIFNEIVQKDLSLTKNDYNNFQKLRYHGLVAKVKAKAGYWLITKRGGQFLRNEIAIPAGVKTFRNHVEEDGHTKETVRITDFKDRYPTFQSEFAYEYKVGPQVLPFI
jgi:predicted transcriptional regulator